MSQLHRSILKCDGSYGNLKEQSKQRHKTCIIVTHDERLTKFCDKVFHMEDGRLKEK